MPPKKSKARTAKARFPGAKPPVLKSRSKVKPGTATKPGPSVHVQLLHPQLPEAHAVSPSPLDAQAYPHLFNLMLDYLSRDEQVVARDVSKAWRAEIDKRLLRHLVIRSIRLEKPVFFHTPSGRSAPLQWSTVLSNHHKTLADRQRVLDQVRSRCVVLDLKDEALSQTQKNSLNPLGALPRVKMVRRFPGASFPAPAETVVVFGPPPSYHPFSYRCNRYVLPVYNTEEALANIDIRNAVGVQQIVLISCCRGFDAIFVFLQLVNQTRRAWAQQHKSLAFVGVDWSLYGLATRVQDQLENVAKHYAISLKIYTHDEYRQQVGEEQYELETNKNASAW